MSPFDYNNRDTTAGDVIVGLAVLLVVVVVVLLL